jgi:hypothetical protein
MNFEVEDYRKKKPLKDPGSWLTWTVPESLALRYLFRIVVWIYVVPFLLLGIQVTSLGLLIQFLVVDYVSYLQYKNTNNF